jgi:hypothetical protein
MLSDELKRYREAAAVKEGSCLSFELGELDEKVFKCLM